MIQEISCRKWNFVSLMTFSLLNWLLLLKEMCAGFSHFFAISSAHQQQQKRGESSFEWHIYLYIRTERFCVDERNWPKYREKLCELWLITTNISVRQFNLYSMFIVLIDWLIKKTTILWSVIVWNVWMIRIVIAREPIRVNANVTRSGGK